MINFTFKKWYWVFLLAACVNENAFSATKYELYKYYDMGDDPIEIANCNSSPATCRARNSAPIDLVAKANGEVFGVGEFDRGWKYLDPNEAMIELSANATDITVDTVSDEHKAETYALWFQLQDGSIVDAHYQATDSDVKDNILRGLLASLCPGSTCPNSFSASISVNGSLIIHIPSPSKNTVAISIGSVSDGNGHLTDYGKLNIVQTPSALSSNYGFKISWNGSQANISSSACPSSTTTKPGIIKCLSDQVLSATNGLVSTMCLTHMQQEVPLCTGTINGAPVEKLFIEKGTASSVSLSNLSSNVQFTFMLGNDEFYSATSSVPPPNPLPLKTRTYSYNWPSGYGLASATLFEFITLDQENIVWTSDWALGGTVAAAAFVPLFVDGVMIPANQAGVERTHISISQPEILAIDNAIPGSPRYTVYQVPIPDFQNLFIVNAEPDGVGAAKRIWFTTASGQGAQIGVFNVSRVDAAKQSLGAAYVPRKCEIFETADSAACFQFYPVPIRVSLDSVQLHWVKASGNVNNDALWFAVSGYFIRLRPNLNGVLNSVGRMDLYARPYDNDPLIDPPIVRSLAGWVWETVMLPGGQMVGTDYYNARLFLVDPNQSNCTLRNSDGTAPCVKYLDGLALQPSLGVMDPDNSGDHKTKNITYDALRKRVWFSSGENGYQEFALPGIGYVDVSDPNLFADWGSTVTAQHLILPLGSGSSIGGAFGPDVLAHFAPGAEGIYAAANGDIYISNWISRTYYKIVLDSDGDGMPDAWEVAYGLNWKNPNDASKDPDHDGLSNLDEYLAGTDPNKRDTDGDGVNDSLDNCKITANPSQKDTDGDGIGDACDVDIDGDGVFNNADRFPLNPKKH